jgi:hypothetical protein
MNRKYQYFLMFLKNQIVLMYHLNHANQTFLMNLKTPLNRRFLNYHLLHWFHYFQKSRLFQTNHFDQMYPNYRLIQMNRLFQNYQYHLYLMYPLIQLHQVVPSHRLFQTNLMSLTYLYFQTFQKTPPHLFQKIPNFLLTLMCQYFLMNPWNPRFLNYHLFQRNLHYLRYQNFLLYRMSRNYPLDQVHHQR